MRIFDKAYYGDRATEERARAAASTDRRVAAAHRAMASRYDALVRGDDVSDPVGLGKLVKRLGLTRERTQRLNEIDAELIEQSDMAVERSRDLLRKPVEGMPGGVRALRHVNARVCLAASGHSVTSHISSVARLAYF